MAAGLPIVAYRKGGALDIVEDGITGIYFEQQTVESLKAAMKHIENQAFSYTTLVQRSKRFDVVLFQTKLRKIISDAAQSTQSQ